MTRYITWLRPKLIITSPPYPGIHVLYHRWQIMGRQETPVPYWIAALNDGQGASYYTFGGRSHLGLIRYFQTLVAPFRSLRPVIHPEASIVQLLSFSDTSTQLPTFMQAREQATRNALLFRAKFQAGSGVVYLTESGTRGVSRIGTGTGVKPFSFVNSAARDHSAAHLRREPRRVVPCGTLFLPTQPLR
jgi:hypothetical protein